MIKKLVGLHILIIDPPECRACENITCIKCRRFGYCIHCVRILDKSTKQKFKQVSLFSRISLVCILLLEITLMVLVKFVFERFSSFSFIILIILPILALISFIVLYIYAGTLVGKEHDVFFGYENLPKY